MPSRKKVTILHPISLHVIGRKWAPHESIFPQNSSESTHFTDKAVLFLFHLKILLSHKMPNRKKVISGDASLLCFSLCTPPKDNSLWQILINSGSFGQMGWNYLFLSVDHTEKPYEKCLSRVWTYSGVPIQILTFSVKSIETARFWLNMDNEIFSHFC